jgi:hypothetical protein
MPHTNLHDGQCAGRLPRRQFLAGAGLGLVSLWAGRTGARGEEGATGDGPTNEGATGDASAPPARFLLEWGKHGSGEGEFSACVGIAIGQDDVVHTAEFRNERVQRFTADGKFLGAFSIQPHAGGLAVDAEGNVYVAHWNSNKLAAYSPSGELLREWGQQGTPRYAATDFRIDVVETPSTRLVRYNSPPWLSTNSRPTTSCSRWR